MIADIRTNIHHRATHGNQIPMNLELTELVPLATGKKALDMILRIADAEDGGLSLEDDRRDTTRQWRLFRATLVLLVAPARCPDVPC
jgi:hypothetical protein